MLDDYNDTTWTATFNNREPSAVDKLIDGIFNVFCLCVFGFMCMLFPIVSILGGR